MWTLVVLAVLCGACCAMAAYVALAHARVPDVCDGIDGLNRGEQRTCRPPQTQDVRVTGTAADVTAYRYATAALPPTEPRTRVYTRREELRGRARRDLAFALAAGGTAALRCDVYAGAALDVLLLDGAHDAVWSRTGTTRAATTFTARTAGVYRLVAAGRSPAVPSFLTLTANVTTAAYRVDRATASATCAAPCMLARVRADETVVVEYTGAREWVAAPVHRGPGHRSRTALTVVGVLAALALGCTALFAAELHRTVRLCASPVPAPDPDPVPPPPPQTTTTLLHVPANENTPTAPLLADACTPSAPPAYEADSAVTASFLTDNAFAADDADPYAINANPE